MANKEGDLRTIRRGCRNLGVKDALIFAIKSGVRYRMTKNGVLMYGDNGQTLATHFTSSSRNAGDSVWRDLRRIGIERNQP